MWTEFIWFMIGSSDDNGVSVPKVGGGLLIGLSTVRYSKKVIAPWR